MRIPGRSVRCGCFQLMPSSSIDSCAGVRWTLPSRVTGQTKRPRSSRLVNRHRPSRSAHSTFIMSPRRPRKINRCPLNGSSRRVFCTLEARPLKPLRRPCCRITTSGTIHRHINNGLVGFGFSAVVGIAEPEGFQAELAAVKLCA